MSTWPQLVDLLFAISRAAEAQAARELERAAIVAYMNAGTENSRLSFEKDRLRGRRVRPGWAVTKLPRLRYNIEQGEHLKADVAEAAAGREGAGS